MSRNYSLLSEYDALEETEIFPESFIDELVRDFGFDNTSIRKLLHEVCYVYEEDGHHYIHEPYRRECALLAQRTLKKVQDVKNEWSTLSEDGRKLFLKEEFYDEFIENLDSVSDTLEFFASFDMSRSRGNPGSSRKSQNLNLQMFIRVVDMLYRYWEETKNQPMGHEFAIAYDEHTGDEYYEDVSQGIQFALKCLQKLDDRITIKSCRTLIKRTKKARKAEALR